MADRKEPSRESSPMLSDTALSVDHLYRLHSGWLARILSARMKSAPVEIDDLVQETYVRLARYAPADTARNPRALLMRIAVNLARDQMRRNVVRGGLSAPEPESAVEAIGCAPDQDELAELKGIILKLPPIYRDVFVLSRFTGLTYDEIASHAGISVKTVEWRMSKALALCASWLRD